MARQSAYVLALREGGFDVHTLGGAESVEWAQVTQVQGVRLAPPRWLVAASFLAVPLGTSRVWRAGQAGRAMILASSRANGLRVTCGDGSVRHVWISDQMGRTAMAHAARLDEAIQQANIRRVEPVLEIRAFFPPA